VGDDWRTGMSLHKYLVKASMDLSVDLQKSLCYGNLKEFQDGFRLPDYVRGVIQEAYAVGKEDGKTQEKRRLRKRADKAFYGVSGSAKSQAIENIFG